MTTKLIPLSSIPHRAREAEAAARAKFPTRAMALDAATYRIEAAEGCYGTAYPPVYGWVLTRAAADALADIVTHMPGGSSHHRMSFSECTGHTTDALGEYMEDIARGVSRAEALAKYEAAR